MKYFATLGMLFIVLMGLSAQGAHAQEAVPTKLQAAIFKKVFTLNNTLQERGDYDVLVVYNGGGGHEEVVKAFSAVGISARAQALSGAEGALDKAGVVYLLPGSESFANVASQKKVLSITGQPAIVNAGDAAIGLELQGGKPKIVVHRAQLEAEGQKVSANLLKLARVIG